MLYAVLLCGMIVTFVVDCGVVVARTNIYYYVYMI